MGLLPAGGPVKLSLIYITGRPDPHLDWTLDALAGQWAADDEIELILVDALGRGISHESTLCGEREQAILARSPQITRVIATPPMPNVWQGKFRVTPRDWWAAPVARNTGIVLATHPQLAFLDDRCRPGAQWADAVRRYAALPNAVAAGSYDKYEGAADAPHITQDHRLDISPGGRENCGGGWLYGCSFTLSLAAALEVNGFEDGCCSLTGEDYIFGMMLANAGYRIDYVPALHVRQDRTTGNRTCKEGAYGARDKGISPNDKSHAALARFGARRRTEFTPDLQAHRAAVAEIKEKQLCLFRWMVLYSEDFPIPDPTAEYRDWFDGELISDMVIP